MTKRFLVALLCMLPFVGNAQTSPKFAHVNSQMVFESMPEKGAMENKIEALQRKYENEIVKIQEEFKKKYNDFLNEADTLPESIRQRRMENIQELNQRIEIFQKQAYEDIQKEQATLLNPIIAKIKSAIKLVGEEMKIDYIFDITAQQNSIVYNSPNTTDITEQVKQKIKTIPSSSAAPAATTKPATPALPKR